MGKPAKAVGKAVGKVVKGASKVVNSVVGSVIPTPAMPEIPAMPAVPTINSDAVNAAAAAARLNASLANGRASTILTGEIEDDEEITVRKKLLGS
jgi:maltose-binding protein MalE